MGLVLFVFLFLALTAGVYGQSGMITPEEVSGKSLREINGIQYMSREYTISPDGKPIPQSDDDQWLPDLSLAGSLSSGQSKQAAPVRQSIKSQTNVPSETKVAAGSNYYPGFQVTGNSQPLTAPKPPIGDIQSGYQQTPAYRQTLPQNEAVPTAPNQYNNIVPPVPSTLTKKSSPANGVSREELSSPERIIVPLSSFAPPKPQDEGNWDDASFAYSAKEAQGSTPSENNSVKPAPVKQNWNVPFSKPADAEQRAADIVLTEKNGEGIDLSNHVIEDIRVSGLELSTMKFNRLIKTRIGSKFNQQTLEEDKRALLQTKQFIDVTVSATILPNHPNKVTVNYDLTPRRLVQYIKVIGNKKIAKSQILEELGMKRGETRLDPYDVENGRLRIIELYKNKGYSEPYVEILRGDRPEDIGVVYLINDGTKQKVLRTTFEGNTIASSGRLRSLVGTKPGFLYLFGGDFSRERLDEDVTKLLEYYRRLGFFDARVDREFEEGEGYSGQGKENAWVTVKYVINEGSRYKIRNLLLDGNKVLPEDKIREKLKVKKDDFYDQTAIEIDRICIKNEYHDLGYVLADITPSQVFTDESGYLDIRFHIEEKNRYRVRDILINYDGPEARTKSTVILNMLEFAPGQLISGPDIRRSENSLRRSGYFNDKPNEGALPTIKIVPDTEPPLVIQQKPDATQESASTKGDLKKSEESSFSWLKWNKQKPKNADEESNKPVEKAAKEKEDSIIRGQSRQLPSSFGAGYQSGKNYNPGFSASAATTPSYQTQPNGSSAAAVSSIPESNSPYADTSMYNNYTSVPNQGPTNAAPSNIGTRGSTPNYGTNANSWNTAQGVNTAPALNGSNTPQLASTMAPGFSAAGTDAVFPGTVQQQQLNNRLLGSGNLQNNETINSADVVAEIREGRTGMFQASIGVNSDYGLIGNISLTERNFDLMKWPTSLWRADGWKDAFRGGGQIFQLQASPGVELQRYSASWDIPHLLNSDVSFGVTGMYGDRNYTDWFETRYGGELRLGYQWTPRFSTSFNSSLYDIKISRPFVNYVPDLNEVLGSNLMYTLGLSASYDTRNHPFLPSEGYVVTGSAEEAMGEYVFPRLSLDARYYKTLRKRWDGTGRWVLGLRSAAGWSGDDTPIYERYFGGGSMNLRGFEYREVTPRYLNTSTGVGGNFEFYNSAELLVPVSGGDEFMLAFFVDTGTVSKSIKDFECYRIAPGFGFRIAIPMLGPAPLALDFAFPVSKSEKDLTQVFSFSISGSR